jgi:hypothetical protein
MVELISQSTKRRGVLQSVKPRPFALHEAYALTPTGDHVGGHCPRRLGPLIGLIQLNAHIIHALPTYSRLIMRI